MRPGTLIVAAAAAALALTACHKGGAARADAGSKICTPFPESEKADDQGAGAAARLPTDPGSVLDDCLHRWGYTLAASSDRAPDVAQATVAACTPALMQWNQLALAAAAGRPKSAGGGPAAPSLLTGQPTTPAAEHYAYAHNRALFYVVQARAGSCAPPPATKAPAEKGAP
jgi:hypothetical protein